MRILSLIILTIGAFQMKAQDDMNQIMVILNEPFQEEIQYHLDTMFKGQDTIFTETDSFMLFTTPDMVVPEIDTLEYKYVNGKSYEWNHNGDELTDYIAVVYLHNKNKNNADDFESNQYLLIATGNEDESFDIDYFESVLPCVACGVGGNYPEISILTNENELELIELTGRKQTTLNDEYKLVFEDGMLKIKNHIHSIYNEKSGNILTTNTARETMMQTLEYETQSGDLQKFRVAIATAELTRPITVDGKLDEKTWNRDYKMAWRNVHSNIYGEKHTMNDLFAKYSVAWNKNNLFIAVSVKDDVLVPVEFAADGIKGDYIQLDMDLSKHKMKKGVLASSFSKQHVSLGLGFDKHGTPTIMNLVNQEAVTDASVAFERTSDGYTAEIQIPISVMRDITQRKNINNAFKIGKQIGFTLSVGDADNRERTETQNIDASSSMEERIPFQLGIIEFFRSYTDKTYRSMKKNN